MSLFNKKDDLINQIFIITKEAFSLLSDDSFNDYKKINDIFYKRKSIINEINELDKQIINEKLSIDDYPQIKKSIKITLEGIGAMDTRIAKWAEIESGNLAIDIKVIKEGRKGLNITREEIKGVNLDVSK